MQRTKKSIRAMAEILGTALLPAVVCAFSFFPAVQAAELGLGTNQSLFDVSLPPGATQDIELVVFNQSDKEPLPIHTELNLWGLNHETEAIEFTNAEDELNAVKWFSLQGNPDFILQPDDGEAIRWTIAVPGNAPAGSYLVMARFIPALPEHYFVAEGPRSIPELGVLFFIKVVPLGVEPEAAYSARIDSLEPDERGWNLIPGASASVFGTLAEAFRALIRNEGLYFFKAKGEVEVSNWWGSEVARFELPEKYLLPGNTRTLVAQAKESDSWFKRRLHFGLYQARAALVVPGQEQPEVSEVYFWVIPWDLLLMVLAVGFALAMGRKRLLAATRALLRGRVEPRMVDQTAQYGIIDASIKSLSQPRKVRRRAPRAKGKARRRPRTKAVKRRLSKNS